MNIEISAAVKNAIALKLEVAAISVLVGIDLAESALIAGGAPETLGEIVSGDWHYVTAVTEELGGDLLIPLFCEGVREGYASRMAQKAYAESASVVARPQDQRCSYIAIHADVDTLPLPCLVEGLRDIKGNRVRGELELFKGQILIECEADHRRKQRGFTWNCCYVSDEGEIRYVRATNTEVKDAIKKSALPTDLKKSLLGGRGEVAHYVRFAHAKKHGLI